MRSTSIVEWAKQGRAEDRIRGKSGHERVERPDERVQDGDVEQAP